MTTPAAPQDPGVYPVLADNVQRTPQNFEQPVAAWAAKVRTAVQTLATLLSAGGLLGSGGRLEQSYIKPVGGIPGSDLAPGIGTAKGAVEYYWRSTLTPPAFVLGPGQVEDGVSPQWGIGGPVGAWDTSPLRDVERPGRESPV